MRHLGAAVVLCLCMLSSAARLRHRINLGTLSSLASSSKVVADPPPSGNRSSTDSASQPEKPLQAIKIDDGGPDVDSALGGGEQAISIVFDKKTPLESRRTKPGVFSLESTLWN
eukprot:INCI10222.1.p2 GENE.INCI10222.1~~INCI10222.1.p2  ORF type:complete len:114 (-),score=16.88 INCI10222.1:234-575(-)